MRKTHHVGVWGCDDIAELGTSTGLVEVRMRRHSDNNGNNDNKNSDNDNKEIFP